MAEWLAGQFMEKLTEKLTEKVIDIGSNYLKDQIRWQTGMKEELQRLRENQDKIRSVVSAAIKAQKMDHNTEINNWIWRLRDAFDEADDVLDDFEYMKHKEQLPTNMARSTMSSLKKIGKRAFKIDPNLKRLERVVHNLDKISAEVNTFRDLLKNVQQEQKVQQDRLQIDRETGAMPKDVLIGRGRDMDFVIQWLGKLPNEEHQSHVSAIPNMYHNISLLSIVGHGGMGKTTLLQHVYKEKVTEEFYPKIWVCVSNNFDVKKVITDMLESIDDNRPSLNTLHKLQENLKSAVESKKFLLVLDDIWEENEERDISKWQDVLAPLAHGGLGSKILITTRMNSTASMIAKAIKKQNEPLLTLKSLEKDECLELLNTHAFVDVQNSNDLKKLRSITEELVEKLYGSPLAAKIIGGVLNSHLDERHWTNILNNGMGDNVMGDNRMIPILKLSYIFLPKYLQNCFAFCSIFPQDHIFDEDSLVRMWIAVGFIQPSNNQGEDLEDIGRRYINDLVKKSLFEKNGRGYKMHDLLHELAQIVSKQECFRIVGDEDSILDKPPTTIRHLFVKTSNLGLLKKLRNFKNLRTLYIKYPFGGQYFADVLLKIFEETRSIRLLSINALFHKMEPKTFGYLKHLRYLEIDFQLSRSVSNLFHLQFLICNFLDIQWDMNNLSNLRYTDLPTRNCFGIGKLKFLQKLNLGFEVKNETGYRIEELEHMNCLRILGIKGLEKVRNAEEARNAKLLDKKKLTDLSLEWDWNVERQDSADLDRYARVVDNLRPHNNLKTLTMIKYMGPRSAIWMNNANLINNLEHIKLNNCIEWQNLPPFGQLPFLKSLYLYGMPKAVRFDNRYHENGIHCLFPSLEMLYISDLEALEDWFDAGVDGLFPRLTELQLNNCPNLKELPYLPPKLKILSIYKIGWKTLNYCSSISKSILLERLNVFRCPDLTIASEIIVRTARILISNSDNLLYLEGHQEVGTVENGSNLILDNIFISDPSVLQMEPLRTVCVTSIEKLTIEDNDGLVSFPFEAHRWFLRVSSSLRHLNFINLKSLHSLPSSLTSLSSLNELFLYRIPLLKSLPDLPPSLCILKLYGLDNLDCLPFCLSSISKSILLETLEVKDCPNITIAGEIIARTATITISNSGNLLHLSGHQEMGTAENGSNLILDNITINDPSVLQMEPLRTICVTSILMLNIRDNDGLVSFPFEAERWFLRVSSSLRHLKFDNLKSLQSLPSYLRSLSSLNELSLYRIPLLKSLPDLPPSLCILSLLYLDNLYCLPSYLSSLSSLTFIIIKNVPLLRELPDLPPSLKNVWITDCDPEFMMRYDQYNVP